MDMKKNLIIIENHIISANTVRQNLVKFLMESGYNVTILSTGSLKELALAKEKGFKVIDVKSSNTNLFFALKYIMKIRSALRQTKADVCLTFTMRPAIWGNLVTRALGIPTITNITGIGPLTESDSYAYKVARVMYKFVLKKTAKVFFQNKDDRKIFLENKFVEEEQTEIIPGSGVDYNYFKPMPQKEPREKFVFLFISRLIKDKGILEFVEAAWLLKQQNYNAEFQVLGPYYSQNLKHNLVTEKHIVQWVEQGIVNYVGATSDVRPFMVDADCIVLPSYREGMSNVLLEAGSMEKPCITTNTTGCNDIVVDNVTGYLCKVKDANDLADKMEKMLLLPVEERNQMGQKARDIIKDKFGKQIVLDAYLRAIQQVLK
jgi:glycosyltransferase involved in cell wall biosynthesis